MKTVDSLFQSFKDKLLPIYPLPEINSLFYIALKKITGLSKASLKADYKRAIPESQFEAANSILSRLAQSEPLQQILGETEFYGLELVINKHVLIPRPETEELVKLILEKTGDLQNSRILDIGTGSGCIAIALKKNLPNARVKAFDIDNKALNIAKSNAIRNKVEIEFEQLDFLKFKDCRKDYIFDLIVSNPPYIKESEKKLMHANVLEFEPELALFVPEDEPLLFYEAFAAFAEKHLAENGMLFLEINENHGPEVKNLFTGSAYAITELIKDLQGKDRFVFAKKKRP